MSATTVDIPHGDPAKSRVDMWIRLAQIWHIVLAVLGAGMAVGVWTPVAPELSIWVRVALSVVGGVVAILSGLTVVWIGRRDHRGRLVSLGLNYLLIIAVLVSLLTVYGTFTGLDSLANTFIRGLPFLALIFVAYLINALGARYTDTSPSTRRTLGTVAKIVLAIALIGFLVAIGFWNGLLAALGTYTSPLPFLLTLLVLILALMLWVMWRQPTAEVFNATNADNEMLLGYAFLSPNLIGFLAFFAGPLLLSLYVSFTNWDAFGTRDWVGFANYARLLNLTFLPLQNADQLAREVMDVSVFDELTRFTILGRSFLIGAQDKLFWIALGNTLKYVLLVVPLSIIPALVLANLLNTKLPGMTFFRAAYFVPSVAAVVGIALVWQWLFNSSVGYINYAITLTVNAINNLGMSVTDPQIRWLSSSGTALLSVIIMASWQLIGFNTVLFLAGLQNIPRSLYEAATVDGANSWQQFWKVTIPLLAPTTFFVVTTTVIRTMQVFEEIFILIPGQNPAGPNNSTLSIVLYLYQKGFQRFEQGYASAIAWVLFLLIFGATLFQFQRQRTSGSSYDA